MAVNNNIGQVAMLNDLVSLPIIIQDWDVAMENNRRASASTTETDTTSNATQSPSSAASATQRWTTGFGVVTDELWSRMTARMKQKLREACVEVLKRTDDNAAGDKMSWEYDDDARFLD
jgi:hypothetical protein